MDLLTEVCIISGDMLKYWNAFTYRSHDLTSREQGKQQVTGSQFLILTTVWKRDDCGVPSSKQTLFCIAERLPVDHRRICRGELGYARYSQGRSNKRSLYRSYRDPIKIPASLQAAPWLVQVRIDLYWSMYYIDCRVRLLILWYANTFTGVWISIDCAM